MVMDSSRLAKMFYEMALEGPQPLPEVYPQPVGRTSEGREAYQLGDGSLATEMTSTVTDSRINQGRPTNIPTFNRGRVMSPNAAADFVYEEGQVPPWRRGERVADPVTGRVLPAHDNVPSAVRSAETRSQSINPRAYAPWRLNPQRTRR